MKILKALLLVFIISFTVNNVNAQFVDLNSILNPDESPYCSELSMEMILFSRDIKFTCFDVTVTSTTPRFLFINAGEGQIFESEAEVYSLTETVCTRTPLDIMTGFYVECRMGDSNGNVLCSEGCLVFIEP